MKNAVNKFFVSALVFFCTVQQVSGQQFCNVGVNSNLSAICNEEDIIDVPGNFYIRVKFHIVRNSQGQGGQTPAQIEEAMSYLDLAYNKYGIYFIRDCDINFIDDDDCFELSDISTSNACVSANDLTSFLNIVLFPDVLGNNLLNSGGAQGIPSNLLALAGKIDVNTDPNFSIIRSFSIAHEVGHCLGLYHTHYLTGESFLGTNHCFGDPECVNGSNCANNGDFICDTPADPNLFSKVNIQTCQWANPETQNLPILCGSSMVYTPDFTNIMSYSPAQCYQDFTPGQARRMRHHLQDEDTGLQAFVITPTTINTNTNWTLSTIPSGQVLINDVLVIESGSTLTIGQGVTVKFTQQGRLIVNPGATLNLSGTLTGQTCDNSNTWKGVELVGNTQLTQVPANQGRFIGNPGAVIENAEIALQTWSADETMMSGGMISCNGMTFLNCKTGVAIAPYPSASYKATLHNCTFINNTSFSHNLPFRYFCHLRGVAGVKFTGCKFRNLSTPLSSGTPADFGYGIFAHNAGFQVLPNCSSPTSSCQHSLFEGLGYGIYLGTDNFAPMAHTIQQADFTNCYAGIVNSGVSTGKMVLNKFNLGTLPGPDLLNGQYGVALLSNLNGFTLEENEFIATAPTVVTIGVLCAQLGEFGNQVRRNKFTNVAIANSALFQNAADDGDVPRGLYYDCNTNINVSEYDFTVFGTIRSEQGLEISNVLYGPAGNQFSYTGTPDDSDFSSQLQALNYY